MAAALLGGGRDGTGCVVGWGPIGAVCRVQHALVWSVDSCCVLAEPSTCIRTPFLH
jgi:hypothetical protein